MIVQKIIDELLEKRRLTLDTSSELTFPSLKAFLASLAGYLVLEKHNDVYSLTYEELIDYIKIYKMNNVRFVSSTETLIDTVLMRGILSKSGNGRYTFRLKGVFEYFIALHMKMTPTFRNGILDNQHYFLSFGTELELYSGFERNDIEFLGKILQRGEDLFNQVNKGFESQGNTDDNLTARYKTYILSFPPDNGTSTSNCLFLALASLHIWFSIFLFFGRSSFCFSHALCFLSYSLQTEQMAGANPL